MIKLIGADVDFMKFSAGEPHVKVTNINDHVRIYWTFENFEEFAFIALICDVLRGRSAVAIHMPYIPFARQDRATTENQPFALRVFCEMLRTIKATEVWVADPHSSVFQEIMSAPNKGYDFSLIIDHQADCYLDTTWQSLVKYDCVIAPDKGAVEKAKIIAEKVEKVPLVTATKERNPLTGQLSNPQIDFGDLQVDRAIIVDDLLDAGGTFIQLADEIKRQFPNILLDLYVTHGIFSRGREELDKRFNKIYVYNDMSKKS